MIPYKNLADTTWKSKKLKLSTIEDPDCDITVESLENVTFLGNKKGDCFNTKF